MLANKFDFNFQIPCGGKKEPIFASCPLISITHTCAIKGVGLWFEEKWPPKGVTLFGGVALLE